MSRASEYCLHHTNLGNCGILYNLNLKWFPHPPQQEGYHSYCRNTVYYHYHFLSLWSKGPLGCWQVLATLTQCFLRELVWMGRLKAPAGKAGVKSARPGQRYREERQQQNLALTNAVKVFPCRRNCHCKMWSRGGMFLRVTSGRSGSRHIRQVSGW